MYFKANKALGGIVIVDNSNAILFQQFGSAIKIALGTLTVDDSGIVTGFDTSTPTTALGIDAEAVDTLSKWLVSFDVQNAMAAVVQTLSSKSVTITTTSGSVFRLAIPSKEVEVAQRVKLASRDTGHLQADLVNQMATKILK